MSGAREGDLLWTPSPERIARSAMARFLTECGQDPADPQAAWRWSARESDEFWDAVWRFCGVIGERGSGPALASSEMPGARWYPEARLNYAENALVREGAPGRAALVAVREDGRRVAYSIQELRDHVARAATGLRRLGVGPGDRVAAVLPNAEHAVIAFLATASIGAIWSSCSPDFGPVGILDRFQQIEPKVLIGVDGYHYNGREHDASLTLAALREGLPGLAATVVVTYAPDAAAAPLPGALSWEELLAGDGELTFERMPFDAPLWIVYSSGTTGRPKPIVHGHGGIVLEHLKQQVLHNDLGPGDTFFWFTTTGWMMWNYLLGGLLAGAAIVAFDGSPSHPDLGTLWRMAEAEGVTVFGAGAPFLASCLSAELVPRQIADLSRLRMVGSTGAPLSPAAFGWVYESVHPDVLLASITGGTDVCTAFAGGTPLAPVYAGEIQTRMLGCAVAAFDENGKEVVGEVGELVVTAPMPSMPVGFWRDDSGAAYREAYFATYPGVWRHGDWCRIVPERGSIVVSGRSDATLNRGGVRLGTAEFYGVVNQIPQVLDSLVVDTSDQLLLFVVLADGAALDESVRASIKTALRTKLSPRHVPDRIESVADLPRTLNGKKLEVPVKRILQGVPLGEAVARSAVENPESLEAFEGFARGLVR
ncbi:MAG TPA: acetoacetate--CoA ligase [Frankiaceae bacterium]|jgi:acetoacetyl-CoA synthetase|nr:acetoacetate--CoA ligase [Frankiaceae bacterium]